MKICSRRLVQDQPVKPKTESGTMIERPDMNTAQVLLADEETEIIPAPGRSDDVGDFSGASRRELRNHFLAAVTMEAGIPELSMNIPYGALNDTVPCRHPPFSLRCRR
jgi:hypothetical protein